LRGEPIAGGFDKPITLKDIGKEAGWTASDVRRALLTYAISEAGGFDMLMAEIHRRNERAENSARGNDSRSAAAARRRDRGAAQADHAADRPPSVVATLVAVT
jgi:hypothetical protein